MNRPLISLCMIVKNEAASIKAVLEAALPYVDKATILDTGSTDGTQDIVRSFGDKVTLYEEPFIDFSASRNRVLDLDVQRPNNAIYQLMLSGDEYLKNGEALRQYLEEYKDKIVESSCATCNELRSAHLWECAKCRTKTKIDIDSDPPCACARDKCTGLMFAKRCPFASTSYAPTMKTVDLHWLKLTISGASLYTPRVFRTGSPWRYEGVVHEVPYNRVDEKAPMENVAGAHIEHVESDPESRLNAIWEVHIPLLQKALEKNPNDERALIFLAQSYDSLMVGFDDEERRYYSAEAMKLYQRRLAIPTGTKVERNYVMMHMLDDACMTGLFKDSELFAWADKLCTVDSHRPETALLRAQLAMKVVPLQKVYEYAAHAAKVASAAKSIENSSPVDSSIEWRAHQLAAVTAKQLASKYPDDFGPLVREHVQAGLRSGGQWALFKPLMMS
jgi:hypothetical protein